MKRQLPSPGISNEWNSLSVCPGGACDWFILNCETTRTFSVVGGALVFWDDFEEDWSVDFEEDCWVELVGAWVCFCLDGVDLFSFFHF